MELHAAEVRVIYQTNVNPSDRAKIFCSRDAYRLLMNIYDQNTIELKEYFKVILLNQANKVLGVHHLGEGGIDGVQADVRQILQIALLTNATSIMVSHNHPSGNPEPSINDKKLTNALYHACRTINITLSDHLIVTKDSYYSFADRALL